MLRKTVDRSHGMLAVVLLTLVGIMPMFAQDGPGLGMNDTAPRLLEAVRTANPDGAYVEDARDGEAELPARVDLSDHMPPPGHQGQIGSCAAWATAYALRSYQENLERGWGADSDSEVFSPSFLYNLFTDGEDTGSHFPGLFALLEERGCATLASMPYTEDLSVQPDEEALEEAREFRIASYARLDPSNVQGIKAVLAGGEPVVFAATVYQDFVSYSGGVYRLRGAPPYGGHGMTLVGYDDELGAFRLINSWGRSWGDGGYAWIDYDTFVETAHEAYRVEDRVARPEPATAAAPIEVSASRGASTKHVRVTWTPQGAPAYFEVFRADNQSASFGKIGTARNASYRDTDALPGVSYLYAVKSVYVDRADAERKSTLSEVARGHRAEPESEAGTVTPGVPPDLSATRSDAGVRLSWGAVETAEGYRVYRFDEDSGEFLSIGETEDTGFVDARVPSPAEAPDSVSYVVSAFAGETEGEATEAVIVTLEEPDPLLPAPQWVGVGERAGPGRQELRWTPVEGADTYVVERFDEDGNAWERVTRVETPGWQRREWAVRRTFRVVAVSGDRRGEPSHSVVMGNMPVSEDEFADRDYRDAEWMERRRSLRFDPSEDRVIPRAQRRVYEGDWRSRDLFDFEEIRSFFEEALRAEREAFRKYREDEQRAFEEFLENESAP